MAERRGSERQIEATVPLSQAFESFSG